MIFFTASTFHVDFSFFSPLGCVVWGSHRSGFISITTCGDLTGGLQDASYPCKTETLKMIKVCLPLLLAVGAHSLLDVASLDLVVTGETHSAQVARICSFFHDNVYPPS